MTSDRTASIRPGPPPGLRVLALALALACGAAQADPPRRATGPWMDAAHGHNRAYPAPGHVARTLPGHPGAVHWGGVGYRYHGGVWYTPHARGWRVVRPPIGIVVAEAPPFFTALTIAGIAYLYANGVYYREHAGGGYEVVAPPVGGEVPAAPPERQFVYPSQGQSATQQAGDEYECHRWAVSQAGFDPSGAAVGQPGAGDASRRGDYQRARAACLDGRGYTVR